MRIIIFLSSCLTASSLFAQRAEYLALIKKADSLYNAKEFKMSAQVYSSAFKVNGGKGRWEYRYNAACSWAQASNVDSAFVQLNFAIKDGFKDYKHIIGDTDLNSLHADPRWLSSLEIIKQNKEKAEANLNKPLVALLDSVYMEDQKYRWQIGSIEKKYGLESKEMKAHWKLIEEKDSINLLKVTPILDRYGWLGADVVGEQGNTTLFIVIQHSALKVQEKYLPMMRDAVKKGTATAGNLIKLEDRIAVRQGRKQTYGTQIGRDPETKLYYVSPLEDPDHVDARRAELGLPPLALYVIQWKIKWDVEQYKKDLPAIEAMEMRSKK